MKHPFKSGLSIFNPYIFLLLVSIILGYAFQITQIEFIFPSPKIINTQSSQSKDIKLIAITAKNKCQRPDDFKSKYDCYADYFYKYAKKTTPEDSFDAVIELKKIDPIIQKSCHPIGHGIGWAAYEIDPKNWNSRLMDISTECSYGALMGMIERFASQNEGGLTKSMIRSLCGIKGGCNHGIGHVALVIEDDIDKALDMCTVLPNDNEQRDWCYSGVFMEHMTLQNMAEHQEIEQHRLNEWYEYIYEFEDFCNTYNGEKFRACWAQMAQTASIKFKGDPKKILNFCRRAGNITVINLCQKRAIPYINEFGKYNLNNTRLACELVPEGGEDFKEYCYKNLAYTAALALAENQLSTIADYCLSIENKYKNTCFQMLFSAMNESRKKIDTEKVCRHVPEEYFYICSGF